MEDKQVLSDPLYEKKVDPQTKSGPQKLLYLIIIAFGFSLIGMGAYSRFALNQTWLPELCIGIGVAIAAPAILSYLYRKYLMEDIKAELDRPAREFKEEATIQICQVLSDAARDSEKQRIKIQQDFDSILSPYREEIKILQYAKEAGLYGLYKSRRDALLDFGRFIENENDEIVVVGSSLLGLLQDADREYELAREQLMKKIESKVEIRFLLTHPMVADLRARQEKRRFQDIGKEIIQSLKILIDDWKIDRDSIKLYQGTPTCFGVKTGSAMLLNPYPYGVEAYASPCIISLREGYFYEHYHNAHFRSWNSEIALPVPDNLENLINGLETYEKSIKGLFSLSQNIST